METTTIITVEGMTCEHCVRAVTEELEAVDAVRSAAVDLSSGSVEIVSDGPVPGAVLAAAVDEAGYRVVSW